MVRHIFYSNIISLENLFISWNEFLKGKRNRKDVQEYSVYLSENIYNLNHSLKTKTYTHSNYQHFRINDPKPRDIHKASVRDRLLHHAIYRILYPYFDTKFVYHSYSCRKNKGTHKALAAFKKMSQKVSKNDTQTAWILKCDIQKFFANIDHKNLMNILKRHIKDQDTLNLLRIIIESFHVQKGKGLPLGNLISQLFVNIYMNEFDQWVKHSIKAQHYIRYADDFVFLNTNRDILEKYIPIIQDFLRENLKLKLHPQKVSIETLASGVDFLGWVHFPHHRVLRSTTKRRMMRKIREADNEATLMSYLGMLKHGDGYGLQKEIRLFADRKA